MGSDLLLHFVPYLKEAHASRDLSNDNFSLSHGITTTSVDCLPLLHMLHIWQLGNFMHHPPMNSFCLFSGLEFLSPEALVFLFIGLCSHSGEWEFSCFMRKNTLKATFWCHKKCLNNPQTWLSVWLRTEF